MKDYETRLQAAAVAFASDYGPLTAAREGDKKARAKVADKLAEALQRQGFDLVPKAVCDWCGYRVTNPCKTPAHRQQCELS